MKLKYFPAIAVCIILMLPSCKQKTYEESLSELSEEEAELIREVNEAAPVTMQSEQAATILNSAVTGMELVKDSNFPEIFNKEVDPNNQRELMNQAALDTVARGKVAYLFFYASSAEKIPPIKADVHLETPQNQQIFKFKDVVIWDGRPTDAKVGFLSSPFFLKLPFEQNLPTGDYTIKAQIKVAEHKGEFTKKITVQ